MGETDSNNNDPNDDYSTNNYDDYFDDYDKEKFRDKSILEATLDRERPLKRLQRQLEGKEEINGEWKQVRLPRCRDEVISLIIMSLGTIINSSNSFADMDPDDAKMMIYEKILEFEYMLVEEVTITSQDFEPIINMCDHALTLFMSSIELGHLTNALKDIFSGNNTQVIKTAPTGFLKDLFGELKPKK